MFQKNYELHKAFEENDIKRMTYLQKQFSLTLPGYGNYHIDVALERGNTDMSKFLVSNFKCQPSLYAKQMAKINGHKDLVDWVNSTTKQRNDTGIDNVHCRFDKKEKAFVWDDVIPHEYRIRGQNNC